MHQRHDDSLTLLRKHITLRTTYSKGSFIVVTHTLQLNNNIFDKLCHTVFTFPTSDACATSLLIFKKTNVTELLTVLVMLLTYMLLETYPIAKFSEIVSIVTTNNIVTFCLCENILKGKDETNTLRYNSIDQKNVTFFDYEDLYKKLHII